MRTTQSDAAFMMRRMVSARGEVEKQKRLRLRFGADAAA
jgi:hypothetical protein